MVKLNLIALTFCFLEIAANERTPDYGCASCQLSIGTASLSCALCSGNLHQNDNCFVAYENSILCKGCYRKGTGDRSLLESAAEDNWMGKNVPPKKRPRCSYLEPAAEMIHVNFTKYPRVTTIGLLRNGNAVHQNPMKLDEKLYTFSNTCGIDSMIQLLCSAYCDSGRFKNWLKHKQNVDSNLSNLIMKIVASGVNAHVYKLRARILIESGHSVMLPHGITSINCENTLQNIIDTIFRASQICSQIEACQHCNTANTVNLKLISVCIDNVLELETKFLSLLAPTTITKICLCGYRKVERRIELKGNCILIEPLSIISNTCEVQINLEDVPKRIQVNDSEYVLRGVVGYQGCATPTSVGHFVAYCYRHNGKWELYNDLLLKKQIVMPYSVVRAACFFYSV